MIDDGRDGWTFLPPGSPERFAEGPAIVVALEATDAVGRAAVGSGEILRSLGHGVVTASMTVDEWVDPLRHAPVADVEQGLLCAVAWPALEVRPGTDAQGRPWALVHGPVPTSGWRAFADALARMAATLRARAVVTLASLPAGGDAADDHVSVVGAATESALLVDIDRLDAARTPPRGPEIAVAAALAHRGIPALAVYAVVDGHGAGRAGEPTCPRAAAALVATAAGVLGLDLDVPVADCPEGGRVTVGPPAGAVRTSDALVDEVEHFLRATGRGGTEPQSRGEDTP